jgi:DNA-binding transcriptional ArsR family regulator
MAREPATGRREAHPEGMQGASSALDLDRRFHEPGRLGILSALAGAGEPVSFSELGRLLSLSDGNLLMHLRTLEEAGWVEARKGRREGARTQTFYSMTRTGESSFAEYLRQLEFIIKRARG